MSIQGMSAEEKNYDITPGKEIILKDGTTFRINENIRIAVKQINQALYSAHVIVLRDQSFLQQKVVISSRPDDVPEKYLEEIAEKLLSLLEKCPHDDSYEFERNKEGKIVGYYEDEKEMQTAANRSNAAALNQACLIPVYEKLMTIVKIRKARYGTLANPDRFKNLEILEEPSPVQTPEDQQ